MKNARELWEELRTAPRPWADGKVPTDREIMAARVSDVVDEYPAETMAIIELAQDDALEAAAKEMDRRGWISHGDIIRALKPKEKP